jgi:hypothetical protein
VTAPPPLRAPAEDGGLLAAPPLEEAGGLIAANKAALAAGPRAELRALARRELLELAARYHEERGEPVNFPGRETILLAGHQPELFHPGVWAKNFALAGLARRHRAAAVNLLVDNDAVKATGIRLPPSPSASRGEGTGARGVDLRLRTVPFDRWQGGAPWEEHRVIDRDLFARFGDEVAAAMRAWGIEPIVTELWPRVRAMVGDGPLGEGISAGRRELERARGCANAELPLSRLCQGEAFARFAALLLADLPRLVETYNAAVRDYRRRHGIKSRNHPVPDLAAEGDWHEAPLWAWRAGEGRRRRLFARARPGGLELRAGGESWPALPPPSDPAAFAEGWQALAARGHKVRSRALTTTLFARLFLADLFVHGIGGAKYDELTDELIRRFFGVAPPAFLVLSATRWLPLPAPAVSPDDRRRLARRLRDLRYNPQRHLPAEPGAEVAKLVLAKNELIAWSPTTPGERRERFRRLRAVNEAMAPAVSDKEEAISRQLAEVDRRLAELALLRRRDYASCLFPDGALRSFLTRLL